MGEARKQECSWALGSGVKQGRLSLTPYYHGGLGSCSESTGSYRYLACFRNPEVTEGGSCGEGTHEVGIILSYIECIYSCIFSLISTRAWRHNLPCGACSQSADKSSLGCQREGTTGRRSDTEWHIFTRSCAQTHSRIRESRCLRQLSEVSVHQNHLHYRFRRLTSRIVTCSSGMVPGNLLFI